jgi:hypothetical protein
MEAPADMSTAHVTTPAGVTSATPASCMTTATATVLGERRGQRQGARDGRNPDPATLMDAHDPSPIRSIFEEFHST